MSCSDHIYDVIVVGAGIEGSSTAYYLTSRYTKNVLLLEQFSALHTRGSSHGGSRITRKAYHKSFYTQMMESAFKMWSEVEKKSGRKIYHQTGILIFGDEDVNHYIRALSKYNHPHKVMTGCEANELYPRQLNLPSNYICVYEENGGILEASTAVAAYQLLYTNNGGHLLDNCKVLQISPGRTVTVATSRGSFKAKKLVLTTGAWTNKLLKPLGLELPLKAVRTEALYWSVKDSSWFQKDSFPCFIYASLTHGTHRYGIPIHEYPNLFKICFHDGLELSCPDQRDCVPNSVTSSIVSDFIGKHFKGVETRPAIMEACLYTVTPDGDSFMDVVPGYSNIIVGTGFSGQGFKLAPVVGQILSELALDAAPSYDLTPFKISRFKILKSSL